MKKSLVTALIMLIPLALTGCTDGSWRDYNTPDRFLKKAKSSAHRFTLSINTEEPKYSMHKDYGLEVRDALVKAGGFKKSGSNFSNANRFFSYMTRYSDGYVGLAPALYCTMTVYEDGFIKIDFEEIKEHKYAYYEMDATKAYEINDLVYAKIPREEQILQEDKAQAYIDGGVDNFIAKMEGKTSIKTRVEEVRKQDNSKYIHDFYDDKQLLGLIKDVEYTRTGESYPSGHSSTFFYNFYDSKSKELGWQYYLYDSYDYVRIYYSYMNRLDEQNRIEISYKIDPIKGKAIYEKALELAKQ